MTRTFRRIVAGTGIALAMLAASAQESAAQTFDATAKWLSQFRPNSIAAVQEPSANWDFGVNFAPAKQTYLRGGMTGNFRTDGMTPTETDAYLTGRHETALLGIPLTAAATYFFVGLTPEPGSGADPSIHQEVSTTLTVGPQIINGSIRGVHSWQGATGQLLESCVSTEQSLGPVGITASSCIQGNYKFFSDASGHSANSYTLELDVPVKNIALGASMQYIDGKRETKTFENQYTDALVFGLQIRIASKTATEPERLPDGND